MSDLPIGPYVYRLVDPRDGAPYYVGKGYGKRAWTSQYDGRDKRELTEQIKAAGHSVVVEIVSYHDTDDEAFAAELAEIERIGIDNLFNVHTVRVGRAAAPHGEIRRNRELALSEARRFGVEPYRPLGPVVLQEEPMPARKAPSPGIGRPLARLESKIDALAPAVEALVQATARLTDATAALLHAQAHPPVLVRSVPPREDLRPSPIVAAPAVEVPRGTGNGHAEEPLAPLPDGAVLNYALADAERPHAVAPDDFTASLAAELAEYAEEDEEPPPPPTEGQIFDQWADRMTLWAQSRMWPESWGPRPGQDGCEAPPELLRAGRR